MSHQSHQSPQSPQSPQNPQRPQRKKMTGRDGKNDRLYADIIVTTRKGLINDDALFWPSSTRRHPSSFLCLG